MRRHRAVRTRHVGRTQSFVTATEAAIKRLKSDNRRVRKLVRTFASWQRPDLLATKNDG